jgi:hypothetical protein
MASLLIASCAVICGSPAQTHTTSISVDTIELNHVYDDRGEIRFHQLIYWRWHSADKKYHVHHWRMVDEHYYVARSGIGWRDSYQMPDFGARYVVEANSYRETWTAYDREVMDLPGRMQEWPVERRVWGD